MYDIFVGRQPIYTRKLELFAYELFFRENEVGEADIDDPDRASWQVMMNALLEIGLDNLVGEHKVFFNITPAVLKHDLLDALDREQVVLELAEGIEVDDALLNLLGQVSSLGFQVALDNFVFLNRTRPLVKEAALVKINVGQLNEEELRTQVKMLRHYDVQLIAERVETREQFELVRDLGFDYYQGYFLTYPNIFSGRRLPANRASILQILSRLQQPEVDLREVELLVSRDISLSMRLLRYINSAWIGLPEKVDSLRRAIVMVGLERIRYWVSLLAMAEVDDRPHDLMVTALARAKMCELLARERGRDNPDAYFLVGLFSLLDIIMGQSMKDLLDSMALTDDIKAALLESGGDMGAALACAVAYERSDWEQVSFDGMENQNIIACYMKAIEWAGDLGAELLIA